VEVEEVCPRRDYARKLALGLLKLALELLKLALL
jgi:hypothetical protein